MSFSVDMFNPKAPFLTKKTSAVELETHFCKEAIENYRGKVLMENFIIGRSWSPAKLFIVQNYAENANWYTFNSRKCATFLVSLSSKCAHVLSL